VFADIKPYVCTFRECGLLLFDNKRTWMEHEMQDHRRIWTCPLCRFAQLTSKSDVLDHLENNHRNQYSDDIQDAVVSSASRPAELIAAKECVFCDWDADLRRKKDMSAGSDIFVTARQFMKHVAKHLEAYALFALPRFPHEPTSETSADVVMASPEPSMPNSGSSFRSPNPIEPSGASGDSYKALGSDSAPVGSGAVTAKPNESHGAEPLGDDAHERPSPKESPGQAPPTASKAEPLRRETRLTQVSGEHLTAAETPPNRSPGEYAHDPERLPSINHLTGPVSGLAESAPAQGDSEDLQARRLSSDSSCSPWRKVAERTANDRLRQHIENSRQNIAPKGLRGSVSALLETPKEDRALPARPYAQSSDHHGAITTGWRGAYQTGHFVPINAQPPQATFLPPGYRPGSASLSTGAQAPKEDSRQPEHLNLDLEDLQDPNLQSTLQKFMNDPTRDEIVFPATLTTKQRRIVHTLAHYLGLGHLSKGDADDRAVHVFKQGSKSSPESPPVREIPRQVQQSEATHPRPARPAIPATSSHSEEASRPLSSTGTLVEMVARTLGAKWTCMDDIEQLHMNQVAYSNWIKSHYPALEDVTVWFEHKDVHSASRPPNRSLGFLVAARNILTDQLEYYIFSAALTEAVLVTNKPRELISKLELVRDMDFAAFAPDIFAETNATIAERIAKVAKAAGSSPTPAMTRTSYHGLVQSLEQERLAIWNLYATDDTRQLVWQRLNAQIASYIANDASALRSIQQGLAQAPESVAAQPTAAQPYDEEEEEFACFCGFSDDDSDAIACDHCHRWNHTLCYYPEYEGRRLPDDFQHYCVECRPRPVDAEAANIRQREKRAPQSLKRPLKTALGNYACDWPDCAALSFPTGDALQSHRQVHSAKRPRRHTDASHEEVPKPAEAPIEVHNAPDAQEVPEVSHVPHVPNGNEQHEQHEHQVTPKTLDEPDAQQANGEETSTTDDTAQQTDTEIKPPSTRRKQFPVPADTEHRESPNLQPKSSRSKSQASDVLNRCFVCPLVKYGCSSTFGSKNEWKRHVSTQHIILGYWRCDQCLSGDRKPNDFNRKDLFMQHVRRMHPVESDKNGASSTKSDKRKAEDEVLNEIARRCYRKLRDAPERSGCLFCEATFEGPNTWDERMEHVGRHLELAKKGGKPVKSEEWKVDEAIEDYLLAKGIVVRERGELVLANIHS
jgi:hypothetical protein